MTYEFIDYDYDNFEIFSLCDYGMYDDNKKQLVY